MKNIHKSSTKNVKGENMNEEQYKAEIEYLKDKINEIDEYYRNIIVTID